jgi:hypothetical protein
MGASQGATGVITRRSPPDIRLIKGSATTVWSLTGVFERGPIGEFKLCTDYGKVKEIFGDYLAAYHSNVSLERAFKGKGNKRIWVGRVVHFTDADDKTTKTSAAATKTLQTAAGAPTSGYVLGSLAEPFEMEVGQTLHIVTDAASGLQRHADAQNRRRERADDHLPLGRDHGARGDGAAGGRCAQRQDHRGERREVRCRLRPRHDYERQEGHR